jgi:hypothetical protein
MRDHRLPIPGGERESPKATGEGASILGPPSSVPCSIEHDRGDRDPDRKSGVPDFLIKRRTSGTPDVRKSGVPDFLIKRRTSGTLDVRKSGVLDFLVKERTSGTPDVRCFPFGEVPELLSRRIAERFRAILDQRVGRLVGAARAGLLDEMPEEASGQLRHLGRHGMDSDD